MGRIAIDDGRRLASGRKRGHPEPHDRAPLRLGFVSTVASDDAASLSGMPYQMRRALEARGATVVPLVPRRPSSPRDALARRLGGTPLRRLPARLKARLRALADGALLGAERISGRRVRRRVLARARAASQWLEREIANDDFDVLFGCCISSVLYGLRTDVPLVYFSDTTARLINRAYPSYRRRSRPYKQACDALEGDALGRASAVVFASALARRSAVDDYGVPAERAFTVPMGANVVPAAGRDAPVAIAPPARNRLRLCVVANDPVRKRVDFAVDVTRALVARGWKAHLVLVGPPTSRAARSSCVTCAGRLHPSCPDDNRRYWRILRETHLMLQPSAAEAFGIAPCEGAHFGRPSVTSDAGGLPEVVRHGRTGLVLPVRASANDHAGAIEALACDPVRYEAMCRAAHRRARDVLSWDRWGDRLMEIIRAAAREGHPRGPRG